MEDSLHAMLDHTELCVHVEFKITGISVRTGLKIIVHVGHWIVKSWFAQAGFKFIVIVARPLRVVLFLGVSFCFPNLSC